MWSTISANLHRAVRSTSDHNRPAAPGRDGPVDRPMNAAKVLVVAPAWVGDMVMSHALVPGLRARGSTVHYLAPSALAELATRMPEVETVHTIDVRHGRLDLDERYRAATRIRVQEFDQAIILPNSFKSALPPLFAGIPVRTGFTGEWRYGVLSDRRALDAERYPRMVDRFAALADVVPTPPRLRADEGRRRRLLERYGLDSSGPVVALCPGAEYGPSKRWPATRFVELARRCTAAGITVWLMGSKRDLDTASAFAGCDDVVDLVGRTSLGDAVDLLSGVDAAVTNDSGLMHVVAAVGVPVVAVFGSTTPAFTPPLSRRAVVVSKDLDCRPCHQRTCPLGHLACLTGISVDTVLDALVDVGVAA